MPSNYRLPPPGFANLSAADRRQISLLRQNILRWAEHAGRCFPWRAPEASEYQKICVEVLLQQTRAETVARIFGDFFQTYPGWVALASAPQDHLETNLRPLGLWRRRAASLAGLARYAAAHDGKFPRDQTAHADIPAVGQYVSNAIALFQHRARRPLLDGNMARLLERFVRKRKLADIRADPFLQEAAAWLVRRGDPVAINWAVLDFAAIICRAERPHCEICPIAKWCPSSMADQTGSSLRDRH